MSSSFQDIQQYSGKVIFLPNRERKAYPQVPGLPLDVDVRQKQCPLLNILLTTKQLADSFDGFESNSPTVGHERYVRPVKI